MADTPTETPPAVPLEVEITAEETHEEAEATAIRAILAHPPLRQHFPAADLWVVSFDSADKGDDDGPRFGATVLDTVTGRGAAVDGWLDDMTSPRIQPVTAQRPPTADEHTWAVSILAEHRRFAGLLAADGTTTYRPSPPLANVEHPDGTVDRVIAVGIRSVDADGRVEHRTVGVRNHDGEIFETPSSAPPPSADCGPPPGEPCGADAGQSQARVRVRRGDTVLWDLVVVRPRASSGVNGSGVELRTVDHRGQRVLFRAHLPIVTVAYDDAPPVGCAMASRQWQHEEGCFDAEGTEPVAGFRLCESPAQTILDSGADGGEFRGVALWVDGDDVVIASQLQAGWSRCVSEWRLGADGTIRPRVGFAATRNPCTCAPHRHHAYWRFDFDILDFANNVIQEYNDPPVMSTASWHTVRQEVRRTRSAEHGRYWRVRNVRASQGYSIRPGPHDGTADAFGAGDLWVLRYHFDEADDGQGITDDPARARPQLDRLVNGESVERQDLVVWYAAHVKHGDSDAGVVARVGPDLVPYQWKEALTGPVTFAPLSPPTSEELRPPARGA